MSNLPASITNMAQALAISAGQAGAAGGTDLYAQFTKFGEWVYGSEKTEVEEGPAWDHVLGKSLDPKEFTKTRKQEIGCMTRKGIWSARTI